MPDRSLVQVILNELHSRIQSDQIVLPTLPEIALKMQQITEDPNADMKRVVEVVQLDTAISARLIKVANSPLVRTRNTVNDISTAIMRLGLGFSCNLITGLAIEQMFRARNILIDRKLRSIRQLSTATAGRATVLAKHFSDISPDEAALGGLVHLIGTLPILTLIDQELEEKISLEQANGLIEELQADIGCKILKHWGFKSTLTKIPALAAEFDSSKEDTLTHGDIIIMARALTLAAENLLTARIPPLQEITLFKRAGIDIQDTCATSPQLEPLKDELEAAILAFSG